MSLQRDRDGASGSARNDRRSDDVRWGLSQVVLAGMQLASRHLRLANAHGAAGCGDPAGPLVAAAGPLDRRPVRRVGARSKRRGLTCGVTATVAESATWQPSVCSKSPMARLVTHRIRPLGFCVLWVTRGATGDTQNVGGLAQPDAESGCSTSMYMLVAPSRSNAVTTTAATMRNRFGSRR